MMRRLLAIGVALAALAAGARAQDAPPASADAPAPARLHGGEALRWRRPIRAWPLLEWDRFDRDVLGADPDDPRLRTRVDVDVLWPIFGYQREVRDSWNDPEQTFENGHAYLLPLWHQTWSEGHRTWSVLPLATVWDGARIDGLTIWPALFDLDWWDGGFELDFPWPFAGVRRRDGAWNSHIFPVWWAGADAGGSHVGLLPLFLHRHRHTTTRDGDVDERQLVSPLVNRFTRTGPDPWEYTAITPLLHRARTATAGMDLVLPLLTHSWNARGEAWTSPLIAWARHREATWLSVTPLFHRWRDGASGASLDLLLPLWVSGDGPHRTGHAIGPVWWGGRTDGPGHAWGVFPLWWHIDYPEVRATALLPLGGHVSVRDEGYFGWAGPAWWSGRAGSDGERAWGVFPLLWSEDSPRYRLRALWPLVGWASHDPAGHLRRFEASIAWPLLQWIADDTDGRRQAWFPWPLVTAGRTDDAAFLTIAPALWVERNESGFHLDLLPAFLGPLGNGLYARSSFYLGVGWPLGLWLATGDRGTTFAAGAGLVYWHSAGARDWRFRLGYEVFSVGTEDDVFELRLLYRLVHVRSAPGEFQFELNPLFRYESDANGWYFSVLFGAYAAWSHAGGVRHRLLWALEF